MEYYVVISEEDNEIKFMKEVQDMLLAGWKLQGGVSVSLSESHAHRYVMFAQALVR